MAVFTPAPLWPHPLSSLIDCDDRFSIDPETRAETWFVFVSFCLDRLFLHLSNRAHSNCARSVCFFHGLTASQDEAFVPSFQKQALCFYCLDTPHQHCCMPFNGFCNVNQKKSVGKVRRSLSRSTSIRTGLCLISGLARLTTNG